MNLAAMLLLGLLILALAYAVVLFNDLVNLKHNVARAWANIDVVLKQRHDELPKLIEVCKQYKQFEQSTLAQVIAARNQVQSAREAGNLGALGTAEGVLRGSLGQIFAVAEAYPELKANEHFMQLQTRISQLENAISDRREFYNDAVNINNVRVEQFPGSLIAGLFKFKQATLLVFGTNEKADVDVKALFG